MAYLESILSFLEAADALDVELSTKDSVYTPPCEHRAQQNASSLQPKPGNISKKIKPKKKLKEKYHCAICNYYGKSKKGITRHNNSKSHLKKMGRKGSCHACVDCNVCKATAMSDLTKCPLCSYSSSNMTSLKLHMNIHNTGRPFRCTYCEYTAQNVTDLIQHYKKIKKYKCPKIGCVFVTHVKSQFENHQPICRWK